MEIKIEKGIPLWDKWYHPSKKKKGLSSILVKMRIGDSFATKQNQAAVNMYIKRFGKADAKGRKFVSRKDLKKTRVWRIK